MIRIPLFPILALAAFLLLPAAVPCRAEEGNDQDKAASDAPREKKEEPPNKSAAGRKKAKSAAQAVKRQGAPEAPLRFDDDDLLKYSKGAPRAEDAGGAAQAPEPEAAEQEDGTPEKGRPRPAPPARKPPANPKSADPGAAPVPPPDPLKPFKDRDQAEKFRVERIQRSRDKITKIQDRLNYLKEKRAAIVDPYRIMPKPQGPQDKTGDAALGARDLLAAVDDEIKSKQSELAAAQQELVEVELRFAAPSE